MAPVIRTSCIIGTAGHIDHGKTALVKALTGMDTDRLAEEKKRGVSIDLGFAHMDVPDGRGGVLRAGLVDVPGHERFIKNMLAGTTGMDLVLFVVAADDGVMPQTREHLDIVRLLGIPRVIFVITKTDLVTPQRVDEVKNELSTLVSGAGASIEASSVMTVSAVTGDGIEALKELIRRELVDAPGERAEGFFRLPVDRSFAVKGFGTVVTGTIAGGEVKKGATVVLYPGGVEVKVRGIQSMHDEADSARAGQRAALNISGVNHRDVHRGCVLTAPELAPFSVSGSRRGAARVVDCLFEFTSAFVPSTRSRGRLLKVHHLTDETLAVVQLPGGAAPGGRAWGRLLLRKPLLMLRGDRFILRDPSINATVGGGAVFIPYLTRDAVPAVTKTAYPSTLDPGAASAAGALETLLEARPGFEADTLSLMLNVRPARLAELIVDYTGNAGGAVTLGGYVVDAQKAVGMQKAVTDALSAFHREHPGLPGAATDALYVLARRSFTGLSKTAGTGLLREVLAAGEAGGVFKSRGGLFSLAPHSPALSGVDAEIERALSSLLSGGLKPQTPEQIAALGFRKPDVDRVIAYMLRTGSAVRIKEGTFLSGEAVKDARGKLVSFIRANGSIKAAEFRDLAGCGRKLAIEILEYFDKEKVTLRSGDVRTLR